MRGAYGVRVFFYEGLRPDEPGLRRLMNGKAHVLIEPEDGWYKLDIPRTQEQSFDSGLGNGASCLS